MRRIDVHTHFFPPEYFREVFGRDRADRVMADEAGKEVLFGLTEPAWDPGLRLAHMEEAGVQLQVLSVTSPNVYFEDEGKSVAMAELVNDFYAGLCRGHPGRFVFFASLPMVDVQRALDELHRASRLEGMRGVILGSNVLGRPLSAPEFFPVFEELARRGLPLFLHPLNPAGRQAMGEFALEVLVGFPSDTTLAAARLVFSGVLERLPHLAVILAHMGGAIPFLAERLDYGYVDFPQCRRHISKKPSEYLKRLYYETALSYGQPTVQCVFEFAGPEHILFGTDYPFGMENKLHCLTVEAMRATGHGPQALEQIFWENAKKVLKLP